MQFTPSLPQIEQVLKRGTAYLRDHNVVYHTGVTRALKGDSRAPLILYVLTNDVTNDIICDVICESSNQMPERLHHTHVTCASLLIGCAPLPLVLKIALPPSYA